MGSCDFVVCWEAYFTGVVVQGKAGVGERDGVSEIPVVFERTLCLLPRVRVGRPQRFCSFRLTVPELRCGVSPLRVPPDTISTRRVHTIACSTTQRWVGTPCMCSRSLYGLRHCGGFFWECPASGAATRMDRLLTFTLWSLAPWLWRYSARGCVEASVGVSLKD